jgi:hypothetical protein
MCISTTLTRSSLTLKSEFLVERRWREGGNANLTQVPVQILYMRDGVVERRGWTVYISAI